MPKTDTRGIPLRLDPATLAGEGLEEFPPLPNQPEGKSGHILGGPESSIDRGCVLFEGDVVVQVAELQPRRMQIVDLKVDEFVHILEGRLIVTADTGETREFGPGDFAIVPKGFTGIREMAGNPYRELTVIEVTTMMEELKELGVG